MKREVCFIIGSSGNILYSDTSHSSSKLEDSRKRWEAIWLHRDELTEISHSHPHGYDRFSEEDLTTMSALESALGKSIIFSIVTDSTMFRLHENSTSTVEQEPWWSDLLRLASGFKD